MLDLLVFLLFYASVSKKNFLVSFVNSRPEPKRPEELKAVGWS